MTQKMTRRRFLQASALVLAAAALTACGGGGSSLPSIPGMVSADLGAMKVTMNRIDVNLNDGAGKVTYTWNIIARENITLNGTHFAAALDGKPLMLQGLKKEAGPLEESVTLSPSAQAVEVKCEFSLTKDEFEKGKQLNVALTYNGKKAESKTTLAELQKLVQWQW